MYLRKLFWMLVCIFALSAFCFLTEVHASPKHATVIVGDSEGVTWSGVVIARDRVLTSSAFLESGSKLYVLEKDRVLPATVLDSRGTLTLLQVEGLGGESITRLARKPKLNESLVVISGYGPSLKGRAHATFDGMMHTTLPCKPGSTGAGVWLKGKFVGILVGSIRGHGIVAIW